MSRRGITLLELLVAMAIAGMILAISFPSMAGGLDGVRLQTSARRAAAFVNLARARAERDQVPVEIVVEPRRNRISALSADGRWERELALPDEVRLAMPDTPYGAKADPGEPLRLVVIPGVPAGLRVTLTTTRGRSIEVAVDPLTGVPQFTEATP